MIRIASARSAAEICGQASHCSEIVETVAVEIVGRPPLIDREKRALESRTEARSRAVPLVCAAYIRPAGRIIAVRRG
jgi:hypothetical protein